MNNYHYNIEHVVQKYCRNIAMLAFTYTKNVADAEDIAQEVFLQLVKSKRDFDSEEHFEGMAFPYYDQQEQKPSQKFLGQQAR